MDFYNRYVITFYDGTTKIVGATSEDEAIAQVLSTQSTDSCYTENDIADTYCE